MTAAPPRTSQYRPELDSIRALAVVVVIINHFSERILPGGFLGVDMFFTLSGYVVTASLSARPASSWSDFILSFYARRIKRIVPALIVCIVVTSFLGCLVIQNPGESLRAGAYALVGASNLYLFWHSSDYFGTEARHNIFTHTWSLGVEEQFYFLFPTLLLLTRIGQSDEKARGRVTLVISGMSLASLVGWLLLSFRNPFFVYFMLPARFWELGLGCVTFLLFDRWRPAASIARAIRTVAAIMSLLLLAGAIFLPKELQAFSTVAVCVAVCSLIWAMGETNAIVAGMSNRWMVRVGVLSYSLYLWHWPVIALSRYTVGISASTIGPQILLVFLLAMASYRYIERPFRYGKLIRQSKLIVLSGLAGILVSGLWILALDKPLRGRFLPEKQFFDLERPVFAVDPTFQHCRKVDDFDGRSFPPPCFFAASKLAEGPTLWLLGDSTTWALKSMASELAKNDGFNIAMFADDSAFPSAAMKRANQPDPIRWEENKVFYGKVFAYIRGHATRGDIVLITANLAHEFCNFPELYCERTGNEMGWEDEGGNELNTNDAFSFFLDEMNQLGAALQAKAVGLVVSAPLPRWEREHLFYCETQWFRPSWIAERCHWPGFEEQYASRSRMMSLLMLAEAGGAFALYDPFPRFCNSHSCDFSNPKTNDNYWIDQTHLSSSGGRMQYSHFLQFLNERNLYRH